MGQAKRRGTREQRIQQAREKALTAGAYAGASVGAALMPTKLDCNKCHTSITELHWAEPDPEHPELPVLFYGDCPECGSRTAAWPMGVEETPDRQMQQLSTEAMAGFVTQRQRTR